MKNCVEYLNHIIDECNYLISDSQNLDFEKFFSDSRLKRAFVRSLEVIGEAVKKLPADFKEKHKDISWQEIAGTRNRLIHDYMNVDYEIVWDIVKNEIPQLITNIHIIKDQY